MRFVTAWLLMLPALAQVQVPAGLRANRDTFHPVMDVLKAQRVEVTDAQLEQLKKLALESIWGALRGLGYTNCYHAGLQSTRPKERLVGRALTIRYLPRRPDLEQAMRQLAKEGDWPVGYNLRAAEEVKPGDVMVVDLGGDVATGVFFGDISALGAQVNGARGAVLWGSTRDRGELEAMAGFPVLAVGFDPSAAVQQGVDWNVPVRVGNATALPGDVVVADNEAVLFFPSSIAAQVIDRASRQDAQEDYERQLVREKKYRFRDVYPLNPELRKKYEAEKKAK
jgi:4-hydroxy-4-methyl-2-oxoglutarate aldolase